MERQNARKSQHRHQLELARPAGCPLRQQRLRHACHKDNHRRRQQIAAFTNTKIIQHGPSRSFQPYGGMVLVPAEHVRVEPEARPAKFINHPQTLRFGPELADTAGAAVPHRLPMAVIDSRVSIVSVWCGGGMSVDSVTPFW
jgi:hypothetical protein